MAHNILKTLTNLLRRPTSDTDVTPTSRTGTTGLDIRPAATQEEVQAIRTLLTEQVPYPNFVPLPEVLPNRHNHLHRELIGAWRDSHLIGAAFIGPAEQEAHSLVGPTAHHDAEVILHNVAMIHDIAVEPAHRRTGTALAIKHHLSAWARDHGAHLILAVPMNQASRNLNQAADYILLPPDITLIMQIKAHASAHGFPAKEGTTWALRILDQTTDTPIRVGVHQPMPHANRGEHHILNVQFLN